MMLGIFKTRSSNWVAAHFSQEGCVCEMPSTPSVAADLRAGHLVGGLTGGQIPALHHLVAAPGEDGGGTPQPEMQLNGNKKKSGTLNPDQSMAYRRGGEGVTFNFF